MLKVCVEFDCIKEMGSFKNRMHTLVKLFLFIGVSC